jgi:hypothetical protein
LRGATPGFVPYTFVIVTGEILHVDGGQSAGH